jgi:hypothetical protein
MFSLAAASSLSHLRDVGCEADPVISGQRYRVGPLAPPPSHEGREAISTKFLKRPQRGPHLPAPLLLEREGLEVEGPTVPDNSKQENIVTETIEELRERRDLLKEIAELSARVLNEDEINAAADHLYVLRAITNCEMPDENDIESAEGHLATLKQIEEFAPLDQNEIDAAEGHLGTLKQIEDITPPSQNDIEVAEKHLEVLKAIEDAA